jgi:hypothetical protein
VTVSLQIFAHYNICRQHILVLDLDNHSDIRTVSRIFTSSDYFQLTLVFPRFFFVLVRRESPRSYWIWMSTQPPKYQSMGAVSCPCQSRTRLWGENPLTDKSFSLNSRDSLREQLYKTNTDHAMVTIPTYTDGSSQDQHSQSTKRATESAIVWAKDRSEGTVV